MNYTRKFILTSSSEAYQKSEISNESTQELSMLPDKLNARHFLILELVITAVFCFVPLLFNNPYRINIFLSWEGAYRMYLGQMPFRDFALPMGYGYWVIPALFFKIFGPYMYTLIKAQVFVNLVSVITFRSILKLLDVKPVVVLLSVLVFCFSYVSFNFWPWYNHIVFVFEMVGIYFILLSIFKTTGWKTLASLAAGAFFIFFSIFTKQDAGALAFLIAYGILTYDAIIERSFKNWLAFTGFFLFFTAIFVLPLLQYDLGYWFNYGQEPHTSRLYLISFLNEIAGWAYWEKFFLFLIVLFVLDKARDFRAFFSDKKQMLFALITIAVILQALAIQVTSPVPPKNEDFFYAFAFAYIFSNLRLNMNISRWPYALVCMGFIVLWWSGIYWRNVARLISSRPPVVAKTEEKADHKYRLAREYKTMEKLYLSESTLDGIKRIKELDVVKKKDLKVLNMSELTSLAYEIPYTPTINEPMWYHQNVAIFQKEVDEFCQKIRNKEYDLVLFETISTDEVINFYPEDVLRCLQENYNHEFQFLAPRTPEKSYIDVFTKPSQVAEARKQK
jgi:hypothetical protein